MARVRLDRVLVARGLVGSRYEAQEAIAQGRVLVSGTIADKPARQVAENEPIVVQHGSARFVSRGGYKLERALEAFSITVAGRTAVDAGAATGGFTDCLVQAGAARVLSVDVGYGQLHERLRQHPQVVSRERQNIRDFDRQGVCEILGDPPVDLLVADLSFTSLRPLLGVLLEIVGPYGDVLLLCKPQFEVGRAVAARGKGVIRNSEDRRVALNGVLGSLREAGAAIMGVVNSPILGPAGNAEFIIHARTAGVEVADVAAQVDAALLAAEQLS